MENQASTFQHSKTSTLLYKSRFRSGTLMVRLFVSVLAVILILTGVLAAVGMVITKKSETGALVFIFFTLTIGIIIFKASGWNIRRYLVYNDRLVIRVLGGIRNISYPASSLNAFNDLNVLMGDPSGGIGIITKENKMIKIVELEIGDFPAFVDQLQKIVRWDLNLKYDSKAG
jgi:hypothetical protein